MRNEITVISDSYVDSQIVSGNVFMVQSLDGNELQFDKLDATLDLGAFVPTLFLPKDADGLLTLEGKIYGVRPRISILVSDPSSYKTGAVVLYKHNGALVGRYYMSSIKRVGKNQYRIECVSPVGVLAKSKHYGGIYNGILFPELISEIIGGVVPFTVSPDLADQVVYGWLPVASRRDNLHQALFAMGAAAQKDEDGNLYIGPLFDDKYTELPDGRVYTGGSLSYPDAASKVSVVEHSYAEFASDDTVTLFEGIVAAEAVTTPNGTATEGVIVLFDNPMHDLVIENGTILESGVNYAVLGPAGSCKLTGQQYTHTSRETIRPETATDGETENVISVPDATLVSVINSENVVNRLYSYYTSAKTVNLPVVVDKERAGSTVQFNDPFGEPTKGIITSMDINMSNTLKADAEIVSDYSPGAAGNFYKNLATITQDGSWTVPENVTKIRVVLIGGGDGGEAGQAGEAGGKGPTYTSIYSAASAKVYQGDPGNGGEGGNGGLAGKVYMATLTVNPGDILDAIIGLGGSGAVFGGNPGSGTPTTFGSLSSDNGSSAGAGYAALMGGGVYALPGSDGVAGGRGQEPGTAISAGGERPTVTYGDSIWTAGENGVFDSNYSEGNGTMFAGGGNGGGAAVGFNGNNGEDGIAGTTSALGGDGGSGATPISAESATIPGSGGSGGHGGGGGGGGGCAIADTPYSSNGGVGGNGGTGGNGAPGIVLIYY